MKAADYDNNLAKKYWNITYVEDYARVFTEVEIPSFINQFKLSLPKEAKTIGDFGCGNGMYTRIIRQISNSFDIYGIDSSQNMLNEAICRGPSSIKYIKGNINSDMNTQLGIFEGFFDVALCNWVLSYSETVADMTLKLKNINQMMRKGGLFLGITVNCHLTTSDMPQYLPMVDIDYNEKDVKEFKDEMMMTYKAYVNKEKSDSISFLDTFLLMIH